MRILLLSMLLPCVVTGQAAFFDLTTNDDGSLAFFTTALPLKATSESIPNVDPPVLRVFRADDTGTHLYLERQPTTPPPRTSMGQFSLSNYYSLSRPEISRDGTSLVVAGECQCVGGAHCNNAPLWQATVTGPTGATIELPGKGRLSASGRYLLTYGANNTPGFYAAITDLETGKTFDRSPYTPYNTTGAGRIIADDGTAVYIGSGLTLLTPTSMRRVPLNYSSAGEAVIDSAGKIVAYSVHEGPSFRSTIHVYRIAAGTENVLAALPNANSYTPYLTDDGRRVMFLSDATGVPQIYVVNADSSGMRQVSHEPSGVTMAAMSGDGKVAWYFSGAAHLYRLNLETGEAQERMGRTPQIGYPFRMARGSTYALPGWGFSDATFSADAFPLPRELGGVSVNVNGVDAPLYSVTPTQIVFQVPWTAASPATVELHLTSASPFEAQRQIATTLLDGIGTFLPLPNSAGGYGGADIVAVHQNWDGLVTVEAPALPGEVLHLYGAGFGRVDRTQNDGMPAPADPLARTIVPVTCWAWGADNLTRHEIPVLFAGLAPGLAGYYQLDVRLPPSNLRPSTQLTCTGEGDNSNFLGSFPVRQ